MSSQPVLGIMTLYLGKNKKLEERSYYKQLSVLGQKMGIDVAVFTPEDVNETRRLVLAHHYDEASLRWKRKWVPFPAVIYDRCRYQATPRFAKYKRFRAKFARLTYMNHRLANKWIVHKTLNQNTRIRPFLPETKLYRNGKEMRKFLHRWNMIYLKPVNGTGGRGILRVARMSDGTCLVRGRDPERRIIATRKATVGEIALKLARWGERGNYVMQQGIDLQLKDGTMHDFRLLIQKNEHGQWEKTGCAGRVGPKNSVTSNLHGGGRAVPMKALLMNRFSADTVESVIRTIDTLGIDVAEQLEKKFGTLCELGLDIAVDRSGHVWLLEVNPKPAREVFSKIGETDTYRKAVTRPLEYAMWLYKNRRDRRGGF